MSTMQFDNRSGELKEWLTFYVALPQGPLTRRNMEATVDMAASRLRWELSRRRQAQNQARVVARVARQNAARERAAAVQPDDDAETVG
jgi:hypothetical protein